MQFIILNRSSLFFCQQLVEGTSIVLIRIDISRLDWSMHWEMLYKLVCLVSVQLPCLILSADFAQAVSYGIFTVQQKWWAKWEAQLSHKCFDLTGAQPYLIYHDKISFRGWKRSSGSFAAIPSKRSTKKMDLVCLDLDFMPLRISLEPDWHSTVRVFP